MPAFIVPGRAAKGQRPSGATQINRATWQANQLAMLCPLVPPFRELVRNRPLLTAPISGDASNYPLLIGVADGQALSFEAASIHGIGFSVPPTTATDNVTSAIWAYPTSTAGEQVLLNVGTTSNGWALEIESGNWKLLINGVARHDTGVAVVTNTPTLIAARRDGTTWQVFRNGRPIGPTTTATPNTPTDVCYIGFQSVTRYYTGHLWHATTWTRAFTDAEMWALYDPATRWDLYWVPGRRVFFDVGAAGITAARARYMPLTGVA